MQSENKNWIKENKALESEIDYNVYEIDKNVRMRRFDIDGMPLLTKDKTEKFMGKFDLIYFNNFRKKIK